jgi:hypothetical protein
VQDVEPALYDVVLTQALIDIRPETRSLDVME